MLTHNVTTEIQLERVVVLGAGGFVGGAVVDRLLDNGESVLGISRHDIDLLSHNASKLLNEVLRPSDSLLIAVAEAPCKDGVMLANNIQMLNSVLATIRVVQPRQVVYVSSDAVYADSNAPLDENSTVSPGSLHGAMHFVREMMLDNVVTGHLAIVRPTLIYGISDPHNGYGPNSFRRLADQNKEIVLFGSGEERRDHVSIIDVARIIVEILRHQSSGVLNIATGQVTSFGEIARLIIKKQNSKSRIRTTPRIGMMPHNGYRAFDSGATFSAFPNFMYTSLKRGV